jgi:single-strand DNA-binding protein
MPSVNQLTIIGNVGRDPEMRYTPSGQAVSTFSVATSRRWQRDGEWQEETEWHNVVAWGPLAERISDTENGGSIGKGDQVYVQGRVQTRSWEGDDGVKRYRTECIADRVYKLGRRNSEGGGGYLSEAADTLVNGGDVVNPAARQRQQPVAADDDFDDLPF